MGGMGLAVEFELKFRATPQALSEIAEAVRGERKRLEMQTTYYDTAAGDLSARKYTLRRRLENGCAVCTVKIPAGANRRGEWELPCPDVLQAIPALCQMGAPADLVELTKPGLVEICGARFTRVAITLAFEDGVLELALDQGELTGGGKTAPLCEVEVELKSGPAALAEQYARVLAMKYGLQQEKYSKFRRARDLAKGE